MANSFGLSTPAGDSLSLRNFLSREDKRKWKELRNYTESERQNADGMTRRIRM